MKLPLILLANWFAEEEKGLSRYHETVSPIAEVVDYILLCSIIFLKSDLCMTVLLRMPSSLLL